MPSCFLSAAAGSLKNVFLAGLITQHTQKGIGSSCSNRGLGLCIMYATSRDVWMR